VGAMISPKETSVYYHQILDYISNRIGKDSELIQRKTYGEINELFGKGEIDLAFICSGPYATGKEKYGFELLATPQVQGSHYYHSYLIVNKESPFRRLEDLRDRIFAFTDPQSNTGKLVPTHWLAEIGEQPDSFFSKTIYTYSHDNSILAVAKGLVDGASIDGLIWEYYHYKNPIFTSNTRIIRKSEPYGIPPIVVHKNAAPELKNRIRHFLFSMHEDLEGKRILGELMIDRFIAPREEWYDTIRKMKQDLALIHREPNEVAKP
jgi:phosphonate transport system substrate-binding protein